MPSKLVLPLTATALTAALFLAIGETTLPADLAISRDLVGWRALHPATVHALVLFTYLGGSMVLLGCTAALAGLLALRRRVSDGVILAATVVSGRAMVELLKWWFDRPRPAFDAHPVTVFSKSFPSGHAANSMITYLAIALIALPARWRAWGALAALALSLAIGTSRPLLGVHWPSDVLGGWLFGLTWVWLCLALSGRFRRA